MTKNGLDFLKEREYQLLPLFVHFHSCSAQTAARAHPHRGTLYTCQSRLMCVNVAPALRNPNDLEGRSSLMGDFK